MTALRVLMAKALRAMRAVAAIASVIASAPAEARSGGRGWGGLGGGSRRIPAGWRRTRASRLARGRRERPSAFSQDRKRSKYPNVKAASKEEERVLKKLNTICRGC